MLVFETESLTQHNLHVFCIFVFEPLKLCDLELIKSIMIKIKFVKYLNSKNHYVKLTLPISYNFKLPHIQTIVKINYKINNKI